MSQFKIKTPRGERIIGPGHPVFVVAEMSGNHNHDYKKALKIIDAAADAGVDAVKLQTYTPDTMTIDSDKKYFQVRVNKAWKGQTLYRLYQKSYTPWEWQPHKHTERDTNTHTLRDTHTVKDTHMRKTHTWERHTL